MNVLVLALGHLVACEGVGAVPRLVSGVVDGGFLVCLHLRHLVGGEWLALGGGAGPYGVGAGAGVGDDEVVHVHCREG